MPPLPPLTAVAAALAVGIASGYYLRHLHAMSKKTSIELTLKERELEAEEKALKVIERAEEKKRKLLNIKKTGLKKRRSFLMADK